MKNDEVFCSVSFNIYSDNIYVLIPPKFADKPWTSDFIKKAVDRTLKLNKKKPKGKSK